MIQRIAMFSVHTCPLASEEGKQTGGMNVYVLELSKELAKKSYQVDVFTRAQDNTLPEIVNVCPGFRVIHLKMGPEGSIPKKELIGYINDFVTSFGEFIKNENISYDIFHCHYYLSGMAADLIKKNYNLNIPVIITFHTLALMKNLVARTESEKEDDQRIDAEKYLIKNTDAIIAPSESDREYLKYIYEAPADKIYVVTPGVDTSLFKPIDKTIAKIFIKADPDHKIILFVGRIEPLKGIDVLMYAVKIILEKNPDFKICLWIAGSDTNGMENTKSEELERLEKLKKTLNILTVVKFVGQIYQKNLPYYYNSSEVVVIPSHYESFGMAALESMACGIPVITTNVSGISGILDQKHEPLITSSNNPLLLASQIEYLLKNQKAHETFGKEILSKVQDLDWSNISNQIIDIYQNLILQKEKSLNPINTSAL